MNSEGLPGHQTHGAADLLAGTTETLASLIGAARGGGLDTAACARLTHCGALPGAALELGELTLIEAARDSGAAWSQVAAAMGARNRQTAQKRHADLSCRYPRPPAVDTAPPETPGQPGAGTRLGACIAPRPGAPARTPVRRRAPRKPRPAPPRRPPGIIGEGRYELVKAPDHAESRAWHVLAGGQRAGLVRPPGGESAAGTAGMRSTTPGRHCPRPQSAGSPPAATPAPATPPRSAFSARCNGTRKTSASGKPRGKPRQPSVDTISPRDGKMMREPDGIPGTAPADTVSSR